MYGTSILTLILLVFFGVPLINSIRLYFLNRRKDYVKALLDLAEKIYPITDKGVELLEIRAKQEPGKTTVEDLSDALIIMTLNDILHDINREAHRIKTLPLIVSANPEIKVKKKYSKYLPILNTAYERFMLGKSIVFSMSDDTVKQLEKDEITHT
jgi:hypothetical protein